MKKFILIVAGITCLAAAALTGDNKKPCEIDNEVSPITGEELKEEEVDNASDQNPGQEE